MYGETLLLSYSTVASRYTTAMGDLAKIALTEQQAYRVDYDGRYASWPPI